MLLLKLLYIFIHFLSARCDRYNHSLESDDDDDQAALDFSNFSTCSPRYSRMCNSPSPLASSPVSPITTEFSEKRSSEKTIRRTYSESSNSPPTVRRRSKTETHSNFRDRYFFVFLNLVVSRDG